MRKKKMDTSTSELWSSSLSLKYEDEDNHSLNRSFSNLTRLAAYASVYGSTTSLAGPAFDQLANDHRNDPDYETYRQMELIAKRKQQMMAAMPSYMLPPSAVYKKDKGVPSPTSQANTKICKISSKNGSNISLATRTGKNAGFRELCTKLKAQFTAEPQREINNTINRAKHIRKEEINKGKRSPLPAARKSQLSMEKDRERRRRQRDENSDKRVLKMRFKDNKFDKNYGSGEVGAKESRKRERSVFPNIKIKAKFLKLKRYNSSYF